MAPSGGGVVTSGLSPSAALGHAQARWPTDVLPLLEDFGRIPNQSPAYDASWETAGHMESAADLLAAWATDRAIPGAVVEVIRIAGLTPTVVVDVPASHPDVRGTVLVYGHYDKQPPFEGWTEGRGPWTPVVEGDRLYGRGLADDGYALPSALLAIECVAAAGGRHGRCIVVAEGSEESGSPHLPQVLARLDERIGVPDLVVALDSSSPTYDRLWITTSLRGVIVGTLTVSVLEHGVHSGFAGGVVPSSFRIARQLLDRIEDPVTGDILLPELRADPPSTAVAASRALADALAEARASAPAGTQATDPSSFPVVSPGSFFRAPTRSNGPCARPGWPRWRSWVPTDSHRWPKPATSCARPPP